MINHYANVLDHGRVEIISWAGGDVSVANAARVSFNKEVTLLSTGDEKLIGYLMRKKHGTPFEHNFLSWRIKAPIFVFREWHRHRVGISINEVSARYTELPEEWYVPDRENVRTRIGKPGNYVYARMIDEGMGPQANRFCNDLRQQCRDSYEIYKAALKDGVAPEQARFFLHVNHYSEMIWTCNARSLMNFLALRNAPDAQWEIRQYAEVMEDIFGTLMPVTHQAFIDNERVAP